MAIDSNTQSRGLSRTIWLVQLVLLSACASSGPEPPPPLSLSITSQYTTNAGKLFYMVVRSVNEKQFIIDNYTDVAGKAFMDPPDAAQLGIYSIIPGDDSVIELKQPPQNGLVGVYFLFTQPGLQWKKLLSPPMAERYDISFTGGSQVSLLPHRSFWSRLWPF